MRGIIPQKIKGFRDISPQLNQLRWHIIEKAKEVYTKYGFEHWDTPALEYTEALGKYMPDADTVEEGVYSFRNPESEPIVDEKGNRISDDEGNFIMENMFLSMRYDLTAPLSRLYAEKLWHPTLLNQASTFKPQLFRRFQFGPVFRYETKLDPGRFREFWQLDFDTVGTNDISSDTEICMILSEALEAIGLERNSYRIKVNNRKILNGLLESIISSSNISPASVLRIIDKQDKIGVEGVKHELGSGRKDASGAFIDGLGLENSSIEKLLDFLSINGALLNRKELLSKLSNGYENNAVFAEGLSELSSIDNLLTELNFAEDRVVFDPSLVRGMAYYTGPIFEVESLTKYTDTKGNLRSVGSISGGGRYDGLVKKLLGLEVPATGASIGVDRLAELLTLSSSIKIEYKGPVLITVFENNLMNEYQKIAQELRAANIPTQVFYGMQKGLKKQLAYADSISSPVAILLGEDELKAGVVTVRNLTLGASMASEISNKEEWKAKAQQQVSREDLVAKVREMLS